MIPIAKTVLAGLLLLAVAAAAGSRLLLEGRAEPSGRPALLRRIHIWSGWAAAALLLALTVLGFRLAAALGPAGPAWASLHGHLGLALAVLLTAKIGFIKAFPALRRFVPGLGLILAGASLVVILGAIGFGVPAGPGSSGAPVRPGAESTAADPEAETGRDMFSGLCAGCHAAGRDASGGGLGLEGLFKRTTLPVSGRPSSEENVRLQLRLPFRSMPAFTGLSEAEIRALLAYLRRL